MKGTSELLFGRIAVRQGMVSREQLNDCLLAHERNPARTLGEVMIRRRILTAVQVRDLLSIQKNEIDAAKRSDSETENASLLGRLLIEKGLCTDLQVNECLRLRGRMEEAAIAPVPTLGDVLTRRGYITPEALEAARQFQQLAMYNCPSCDTPIETDACPKCGTKVPAVLAQMAGALKTALNEATEQHDIDLPAEVRVAAGLADRHFGKYVLVAEIGRGGSGVVWKAWQKDRNRIVALKMLSHESETAAGVKTPFGDAEDVRRFYNETRAATELRHENIVPIHEFAYVDSTFFYTMDFIEGKTLDDLVRDGPPCGGTTTRNLDDAIKSLDRTRPEPADGGPKLPMREALRIMRDTARAVHFAHEKGIYHRDLKPSNIIVTPEGKPCIADFGLAKVVRIGDSAYVKGVIMGTPYYMPPEQAEGDMEKVDHLSDVYSLGAVTYEAVTGVSPYAARSPDTVIDLLPTTPPERPQKIRADLAEGVAAIIVKAMRKEKKHRYPSAAAFADDIDRYLAGKPLAPEPAGARSATALERFVTSVRNLLGWT